MVLLLEFTLEVQRGEAADNVDILSSQREVMVPAADGG